MAINIPKDDAKNNSGKTPLEAAADAAIAGGAPNISTILQRYGSQSQLSNAANEYVEEIRAGLEKDYELDIVVNFINDGQLDVVSLSIKNDKGEQGHLLLTFAETYLSTDYPPTEFIRGIAEGILHKGQAIIDNLVITPADYARAKEMKAHIGQVFSSIIDPQIEDMTIESFRGNSFHVCTNLKSVVEFVRIHNPQDSMPRIEYGVLLSIIAPRRSDNIPGGRPEPELKPLLAIGGYTHLASATTDAYNQGLPPRFVPIVTISTVVSSVSSDSLALLALPLAADAFINRQAYMRPFQNFAEKEINIGNLVLDPKDQPMRVKSIAELQVFREKYLELPWLAIDIVDGRSRIRGIENLAYDPATFRARTCKFLGIDPNDPNVPHDITIDEVKSREYIGTESGGSDSRSYDYLTVLAKGVKDVPKAANLLRITNDPSLHLKQISEWWDVKALYSNTRVFLNSSFVHIINAQVNKALPSLSWDNADNYQDNSASLLVGHQGNQFQGMPMLGAQQQLPYNQAYNPFAGQ